MKCLKVHIAMIGGVWKRGIEHSIIRRAVDQIVLVYGSSVAAEAYDFLVHLQNVGVSVVSVTIDESSFSAVLSAVLSTLNSIPCDDCRVEFNVTCASKTMAMVATVAAAILQGTIVYSEEMRSVDITEVWPMELTNLTRKKMEVLHFLAEQAGPVYQRSIAKELDIPQSGISRYVKDLELAGYLSRETISRRKVVCISDLGSAIMHSKRFRKRRIWAKKSPCTASTAEVNGLTQKHNTSSWASGQLQGAGW